MVLNDYKVYLKKNISLICLSLSLKKERSLAFNSGLNIHRMKINLEIKQEIIKEGMKFREERVGTTGKINVFVF